LSPGAVNRLGTKRWRHSGSAYSPSWSADGKRLAVVTSYGHKKLTARRKTLNA
jgi:Tol biopolymer transport system component